MKRRLYILLLLASLAFTACIHNDLPYPTVIPTVASVKVEGGSVSVDQGSRMIMVDLEETADIRAVHVSELSFNEDIAKLVEALPGTIDLSSPYEMKVRTYQEYIWKMVAQQNIERYFTVSGQKGSSYIDAVNRRAIAYVGPRTPLSRIAVTSLKLGPAGISTYSKSISEMSDFTNGVSVDVSFNGRTESWMLYVERSETLVDWISVDAWTRVAWLSAAGVEGSENGFRYRQKGSQEWLAADVFSTDGGSFVTKLDGLEPLTTYECIAFSGTNETDVEEFTTGEEQQLPNAGFEVFSKCESPNYYSFFDPSSTMWSSKWWDSGNFGSTTVGASYSICAPDTEDKVEGNASSRMDSHYVVIKFAAGNMFSGEFAGLVGVQGGKVNFGRPFTMRPQALRLQLKYNGGVIDNVNTYPDNEPVKMGDNDRCQVFVALGSWDYHKYGGTPDSPVQVNTTEKSTFFNPSSEDVIAYGSFETDKSTDGWVEVTIPLDYRSYSAVPTHIIVSCAASKYGDYFTGSSQSTLWVDDMKLIY